MYLGSWSISMAWKPRLWRDQAIHRSWEWNHTIIHKELWRMAKNQQQNHCSVRLPKIWFTTSPWKSLLHFQKHRTPKSIVNSFTHKLFHPSKTWIFVVFHHFQCSVQTKFFGRWAKSVFRSEYILNWWHNCTELHGFFWRWTFGRL